MMDSSFSYIERERLLEPLLSARLGLVEAGAGYGKSVLVAQCREALGVASVYVPLDAPDDQPAVLVASLRRALHRARLSDLAAVGDDTDPIAWIDWLLDTLAESDPIFLIFDDVHHLRGAGAATAMMRLARGLASQHRLLLATRRLAGSLAPFGALEGIARLNTAALAFRADEASELLALRLRHPIPEREVAALVEATQGWVTALVVAAASWESHLERDLLHLRMTDAIATPMRSIMSALPAAECRAVAQLAHLPFFSPELCDEVAGSSAAFDRLVEGGIPIARNAAGWWELPGPVVAYLVSQEPLAEQTVLAAADLYRREGDSVAAIRVLLGAGLADEAAAALAAMAPDQAEELGLAMLREFVDALPEAVIGSHLRVLLHVARVAEVANQAGLRAGALARAGRLLVRDAPGVDLALCRELDAEQARDLMWDERTRARAKALAGDVIDQAGEEELVARARAHDVLGRLASIWSSDGPHEEAERLLFESARLARRAGQRTWAAQALIQLANGYFYALSRFDRALEVLDEALADLPARHPYRALALTFRADTLTEIGRFSEAEGCIGEMRELGHWSQERWVLAYAAWSEAALASYQGDQARTLHAVLEAERHRDAWYEHPAGIEFLCQSADYLDRVGEHDLALRYLSRARERMAGYEHPVQVYGAAVLGRSGDPDEAEDAIAQVLAGAVIEAQERWPLLLLRAHAALRRGSPGAGRLAADAIELCQRLGHPEGPLVRERPIAEKLLPLAAQAGSPTATALNDTSGKLSIRLLGGFEVARAGRPVQLPAGRPAKAVRAVALAGGRMHAEELIELLWPETNRPTGRNRLRNLLSRLRATAGPLLDRHGEMIELAAGSEIDSAQFALQVRSALAAQAAGNLREAAVHARSALGRYRGDLLPDDRYEGWAAAAEKSLRLSYLELLDLLATDAEQRGEIDEAARLLTRAVDAEPLDEQRHIRLAELLRSQGRTGSALVILHRARAALGELGLDPSPRLQDLERTLGAPGRRGEARPPSNAG